MVGREAKLKLRGQLGYYDNETKAAAESHGYRTIVEFNSTDTGHLPYLTLGEKDERSYLYLSS